MQKFGIALVLVCVCYVACDRSAPPPVSAAPPGPTPTSVSTPTPTSAPIKGPITVEKFANVIVSVPADVTITKSTTPTIALEGDPAVLAKIVWTSSNGTLEISSKESFFTINGKPPQIAIGAVDLGGITLSGSGDITADRLAGKAVKLTVTGSGTLNVKQVAVENLAIVATGSGDINAAGTASTLSVDVKGSGDVDVQKLKSSTVNASVMGSGSAKVWATTTLNAKVMGSGDIAYAGDPKVMQSVLGSGEITKL